MIRQIKKPGRWARIILESAIVLLASACNAQPIESARIDPIRVENVCVSRITGYDYSVARVVDFWLVHASRANAEVFSVYVGNNPDLRGDNAKYKARTLINGSRDQVIRLGPPQDGHMLGVPRSTALSYFHLLVDPHKKDYSVIVGSIRFCK